MVSANLVCEPVSYGQGGKIFLFRHCSEAQTLEMLSTCLEVILLVRQV